MDFMDIQSNFLDESPEYIAFVNKFKPKRTTDDCYTPPLIYETIKGWACRELAIVAHMGEENARQMEMV